jgi:predicted nucleotidyltransferase
MKSNIEKPLQKISRGLVSTTEIHRALAPYFARRREVSVAYLFGSAAQRRTHKLSDIDIALLVDEKKLKKLDAQEPYGYKAAVITDLMALLHTHQIDLVLLHEVPPLLAYKSITLWSAPESSGCLAKIWQSEAVSSILGSA